MTIRPSQLPFARRVPRAVRPAHVVLALTVMAVSCFHSERPPEVQPRNTLGLSSDADRDHVSEQPFGVVFGAPRGETSDQVELTLVFNRPMRATDLAGQEAPAPVRLKPDTPGTWRWIGTRGLYFAPDTKLPLATSFEVTVPSGTRALDGSALENDFVLQFSTARPRLVSSSPWDGATGLKPSADFTLRFNQPVELAELQRALTLQVGGDKGRTVAFDAQRPDPQNPRLAKLVPKAPLPLASTIKLSVDPSLKGAEGPLAAGTATTFRFETYGPLRVGHLECSRDTPHEQCSPRSSLSLSLSNPVKYEDAKDAISVVPAIKLNWWDGADPDHTTRYVNLDASFQPARTYTIRVKGSLKDVHGQSLGRDEVLQVRFDDLWPYAEIGVSGTFFEPGATREIPVASVNVTGLDLVTAPLGDDGIGLFAWSEGTPKFDAITRLPHAKSDRLRPAAAPNHIAKHLVRPSAVLGGADQRGPMVIGMRYTARPGTKEAREVVNTALVQVTNLGISAKLSRFGSLVWVTSLSDGAPVPGAEVRIRHPGGTAPGDHVIRADANGMALIDAAHLAPARSSRQAPLIIVKHGKDWAYRSADDLLHGWRYGVHTDLHGAMQPFGMMFTERGVYRPGDTVQVKGIVRTPEAHGTSTPAGQPVLVSVATPNGEKLAAKTLTITEFGTFAIDVKVPGTAMLGSYDITASVGGRKSDGSHVYQSFQVAEYRPAEFKVGVELDRRSYIRGDNATCTSRGDYLFGAPMTAASVRATLSRGFTYFDVPKTEGFSTTDSVFGQDWSEQGPGSGAIHSGEAKLDGQGKHEVATKLAMPGQRSTETVVCEAEVMDLSRQAVASSSSAVVHPAEFYVAIRTAEEGFATGGEEVTAQVLAVTPDGVRRAGVPVAVELVRRTWVTARESAGRYGYHSASRPVDTAVSQCSAITAAAPASCKLRVPKAGYYLVRGKATDKRGNPVAASTYLYALGDGESGWVDRDDMRVELVPDKHSYEVGQTARILVKSPFREADALVTVERAGVYSQQTMKLRGSMPTLTVPITPEFMPNAYVSVVLVRGRSSGPPAQWNAPDVGAPAFRVGYASLRVNPEARRLEVAVLPNKQDYRPGETVDVNLLVRDRTGKGARTEITLYAVDEGVLMLTGYKTPDPIPIFTAPRPLRVGLLETRSDLARLTLSPLQSNVGQDKGLEGGGGGDDARKDFRTSAYFNSSIVTDAAGRARVSFRLPDGLTSYRIMAVVAGTDDRFGFGESRVTTSLPLMARPAFPRLLRAGDQIDAGVVVTSKDMARSRVDVRATIDGLELVGDAQKAIELDRGESREVTFRFRAKRAGNAKLRFQVTGGGESDTVEFGMPIKSPTTFEAVALYGSTKVAAGEQLGDLTAMRGDVGGLEVSVASTALVGLNGGVQELMDYPYGCTEQLTSRLVPLLPLRELARTFDLPLPANTDKFVADTITKIVRRQRHDGGFGMWDDSPRSNPWVTTYALWGLGVAKRLGAAVPDRTLDRATGYVREFLKSWEVAPLGPVTAAFMLDVLAENGAPDAGYMTRLFEKREALPLFGRAYLAHAMAEGKGDAKALEALTKDLEGHVRVQGNRAIVAENVGNDYAALMDSSTRTTALVLRSLLAARRNHPMGESLARGLLATRHGGKWDSTQDNAYALLALDAYRKAQERETPNIVATVWFGDDRIAQQKLQGRATQAFMTTVPASRLSSAKGTTLAFQLGEGAEGTLFYEARLRYARRDLPSTPLDRGFYVQKAMRVVSPESLSTAVRTVPAPASAFPTPHGGELVLVDLLVVAPQPHDYVVIDDPIPAGLEAIDSQLATTAGSLAVGGSGGEDNSFNPGYHDEEDEDRLARGGVLLPSWFRQELRDDRVVYFVDHMAAGMYHYRYLTRATTVGTFLVPATKAEAMYQPEIFGRTAGAVFQVKP